LKAGGGLFFIMFKRELTFRTPLMNAAGLLGFAPEPRSPIFAGREGIWDDFGAFVTNPISLRPRFPTTLPELIEYPGGFLMHTGLPNPGFCGVL
jgi:dihydroorotate dehydrogenase